MMNYQISAALRETKKYETPLYRNAGVLGNFNLVPDLTAGNGCPSGYRHQIKTANPAVINDHAKLSPYYTTGATGFWLPPRTPASFVPGNIETTMQQLPLTLRFFQDGKMILHIESDSGSNFNEVKYNFR